MTSETNRAKITSSMGIVSLRRFALALSLLMTTAALLVAFPSTAQQSAPPADAPPAVSATPPGSATVPEPRPPQSLPGAGASEPAPHDMSPWSMFLGADIVVKFVMVGLAIASLATWTILLAKTYEFSQAQRRINRAIRRLTQSRTLVDADDLFATGRQDVVARLVKECVDEVRLSSGVTTGGGIRDRAAARCTEVVRAEGQRLRIGTGMLATIGSTAPFVGLFGTVWGIMNSFVGIAKAQTTNLAVVAPGIAEALFATAVGLVAAIPAVIIYNHFARVTKNHLERVNRASGIALRLLSRDLDHARREDPAPARN